MWLLFLKISFVMPLIDDGVEYKSDNKSDGYHLVDGVTGTIIAIKPTPLGRKEKIPACQTTLQ
jgi:hypothetical protein